MASQGSNIVRRDRLPVFVDGREYEVTARHLSRSHTLAEFLHDEVGRAGREACGEGGCGACSVIVTRPFVSGGGAVELEIGQKVPLVEPAQSLAAECRIHATRERPRERHGDPLE